MQLSKIIANRRTGIIVVMLGAMGAGCYLGVENSVRNASSKTVQRARELIDRGDSSSARRELRWLLWFEPEDPESLVIVAQSFLKDGDALQAITLLEKVPRNVAAYRQGGYSLALALLAEARLEQAESVLTDLLDRYPRHRPAREELRWLYFNEFRTRDVLRLLEETLVQAGGEYSALPELLDSEYNAQSPQEGINYLADANRRQSDQAPVMTALAHCHWQLGQLDTAQALLDRAAALEPENVQTRLLRSTVLLERNQIQRALVALLGDEQEGSASSLKGALERDDRYWHIRSRIAEAQDDGEGALREIERALTIRPDELAYSARKADLLRLLGRNSEAGEAAHRVARIVSTKQEVRMMMEKGKHRSPNREDCLRIAELCRQRGRTVQADAWASVSQRFPIR